MMAVVPTSLGELTDRLREAGWVRGTSAKWRLKWGRDPSESCNTWYKLTFAHGMQPRPWASARGERPPVTHASDPPSSGPSSSFCLAFVMNRLIFQPLLKRSSSASTRRLRPQAG